MIVPWANSSSKWLLFCPRTISLAVPPRREFALKKNKYVPNHAENIIGLLGNRVAHDPDRSDGVWNQLRGILQWQAGGVPLRKRRKAAWGLAAGWEGTGAHGARRLHPWEFSIVYGFLLPPDISLQVPKCLPGHTPESQELPWEKSHGCVCVWLSTNEHLCDLPLLSTTALDPLNQNRGEE